MYPFSYNSNLVSLFFEFSPTSALIGLYIKLQNSVSISLCFQVIFDFLSLVRLLREECQGSIKIEDKLGNFP